MKTTEKRKTGDLGESIVVRYLKNRHFTVVDRNYLLAYGEIDVIAEKSGVFHFIEVKSVSCEIGVGENGGVSRENTQTWNPADRIDSGKLRKIERAALTYIAERGIESDFQIDAAIVEIDEASMRARVEFLENVAR